MSLRDDFAALVTGGARFDLGRGALTLARVAYPELEADPYLARLDTLADGARARLTPGLPPAEAALTLASYLFRDLGFRGNQDDYYDPRNSFLNDVLERRTGIPISLSILLLETGARLGLELEGVGFPGHFLVRAGGVLLDPFFGGRLVGDPELLVRYRALRGGQPESLPPDALATMHRPAILARVLRNLVRAYLDQSDHARALASVDLLLVLEPNAADEIRLRGLLYEQLDCAGAALGDFKRYLALAPDAPDADAIRNRLVRLSRTTATIH